MKYILMMHGTQAGVGGYQAWARADAEAHMAALRAVMAETTATGEFVATQGLAAPAEARVVRGEKDGLPVTDGIFPEAKEFLLGYWIVDVESAERAFAIAARISAAPGPSGVPTNMPIEVRPMTSSPAPEKL